MLETLLSHRSVRQFSDRALPGGLPELLVVAAQSAPTSSNLQAMSIIAVEDHPNEVAAKLGLPPEVFGPTFGYPTRKLPLPSSLAWDSRWSCTANATVRPARPMSLRI